MAVKVSIYYEWEKLADTANIYSIILQHAKVVCLKISLDEKKWYTSYFINEEKHAVMLCY